MRKKGELERDNNPLSPEFSLLSRRRSIRETVNEASEPAIELKQNKTQT